MIPTPLLYFATHSLEIPNGFMVTGSHNPKNYNGIKMIINGSPLFDKDIYALRDWIQIIQFPQWIIKANKKI